jgi:manganese transport protein
MLGNDWASMMFGIALVAAGQSSTITGTLAGQIVMEGYLNIRIAPWLRRLITRLIAIIPAYIVILAYGEEETGALLVFSQVILSLQLGFAIIPLIHFTSDKAKMGVFVISTWIRIAAWAIALVIVGLNVKLVMQEIEGWLVATGPNAWMIWAFVVPVCAAAFGLLVYITLKPVIEKRRAEKVTRLPHGEARDLQIKVGATYQRIAVTIDFSDIDSITIRSALSQGGKDARYLLIHIVETVGAMVYGSDIADRESSKDAQALEDYAKQLRDEGYQVETQVGFGNPRRNIPKLVKAFNADLLVMGAHGHRLFKDLILGATVDTVRHRVGIPVLIVQK